MQREAGHLTAVVGQSDCDWDLEVEDEWRELSRDGISRKLAEIKNLV